MSTEAQLRTILARPGILIVPGAVDALNARLVEEAGFEAVYATGAGIANALLGLPDLGLATMTEILGQVRHMVAAVDIPVISDIDTGYGNPLNVFRTVREFERAGAAAIQIEDQVTPKRCGHFSGKEVVPEEEMVRKIVAAIEARQGDDLMIIARTDSLAVDGLEAAIQRGRAYARAGADLIFVEAPRTDAELAALPSAIPAPLLVNMTEGGRTPLHAASDLEQMGYKMALFPNSLMRASLQAGRKMMETLYATGQTTSVLSRLVSWEERQRLVRLPEYEALESRLVRDPIIPDGETNET